MEKDFETMYLGFKQLSLTEKEDDAIVVAENRGEGAKGDSESNNVGKDVEVVLLDDGSEDGTKMEEQAARREGGGGEFTGSGVANMEKEVVSRDEGSKYGEDVIVGDKRMKDGEERGEEVVSMEGSKEGREKEKEVVWVENANEGKDVESEVELKGLSMVWINEKLEIPCYPQRPNVKDCTFYLRTGTCAYKQNCRFNHPDRRNDKDVLEVVTNGKGDTKVPEAVEKWTCKYYLSPSGCKYGGSCKFRHQPETHVSESVELNFIGLPIRQGERKCSYYMQTGSCKFSIQCRYHHPEPTEIGGNNSFSDALPSSASQVRTIQSFQPYLQGNDYEMAELPRETGQISTSYCMKSGNCIRTTLHQADYLKNQVIDFPTYQHPRNGTSNSSACLLSPRGLPLRPGRAICRHYNLFGICKFGPACIYDHSDLVSLD